MRLFDGEERQRVRIEAARHLARAMFDADPDLDVFERPNEPLRSDSGMILMAGGSQRKLWMMMLQHVDCVLTFLESRLPDEAPR